MGYSRRTLNYLKRIALSNPSHMMNMADPIDIGVETLKIDSGYSLEKEFTQLIRMNPSMVLYLTINQVDSCHGCVCGPLTWDTRDILWMDDRVLIMTYKSLVTRCLKRHILDTTWSPRRWLCDQDGIIHPRYLRRLTQGMRWMKSLAKVVEISNLSDWLGFDSWPYPKSFMSLM